MFFLCVGGIFAENNVQKVSFMLEVFVSLILVVFLVIILLLLKILNVLQRIKLYSIKTLGEIAISEPIFRSAKDKAINDEYTINGMPKFKTPEPPVIP